MTVAPVSCGCCWGSSTAGSGGVEIAPVLRALSPPRRRPHHPPHPCCCCCCCFGFSSQRTAVSAVSRGTARIVVIAMMMLRTMKLLGMVMIGRRVTDHFSADFFTFVVSIVQSRRRSRRRLWSLRVGSEVTMMMVIMVMCLRCDGEFFEQMKAESKFHDDQEKEEEGLIVYICLALSIIYMREMDRIQGWIVETVVWFCASLTTKEMRFLPCSESLSYID
jgi:hypothetical protein